MYVIFISKSMLSDLNINKRSFEVQSCASIMTRYEEIRNVVKKSQHPPYFFFCVLLRMFPYNTYFFSGQSR